MTLRSVQLPKLMMGMSRAENLNLPAYHDLAPPIC